MSSTDDPQDGSVGFGGASISDDGRFVAFSSASSNLVAGDTNGGNDVFLRDRVLGTTTRINLRPGGGQSPNYGMAPEISGDGAYVFFTSTDADLVAVSGETTVKHLYRWQRSTGTIERVTSMANGDSGGPSSSDDGRYVAFATKATNLVSGHTGGGDEVLLKDMSTGAFSRVSLTDADAPMTVGTRPSISDDGTKVAFVGFADDVWAVFVRDLSESATIEVSAGMGGILNTGFPRMSGDGSTVLVMRNADSPTFVTTMYTFSMGAGPATQLASYPLEYDPTISDDGRFIAFGTAASLAAEDVNNIVDIYVYDRDDDTTTLASVLTDGSPAPWGSIGAISGDGTSVLFYSTDENISADPQVFVRALGSDEEPPPSTTSTSTTTSTVFDASVCQWEWGGLQEPNPQPCPAGNSIELSSGSRSPSDDRSGMEVLAFLLVAIVGLALHQSRERRS